jgi:hypothetical protein
MDTADLTVDTGLLSGSVAVRRIIKALQELPSSATG